LTGENAIGTIVEAGVRFRKDLRGSGSCGSSAGRGETPQQLNPKSEARNPKQFNHRKKKTRNEKRVFVSCFLLSDIRACLGFRASDFVLSHYPVVSASARLRAEALQVRDPHHRKAEAVRPLDDEVHVVLRRRDVYRSTLMPW
jgi:hypothetical protein